MEEKIKRSLIKKYFSEDTYIELLKITKIASISNNEKNILIKDLLRKKDIPFSSLGPGTNRMAVNIDGYAVKFALDSDGMIDNRREFKYTKKLQPYVIKVYECTQNGLIAVTEFVELFTIDDFHMEKETLRKILQEVSGSYLIGDVGINSKNYVNWGRRDDGQIVMLDFAYIYSVSFKSFRCSCDDMALLKYDDNFVKLICPVCGKSYDFADVRRRISKKDQEKEIGNILDYSYKVTKDNQSIPVILDYEPESIKEKKKANSEKARRKAEYQAYLEEQKRIEEEGYWGN